MNELQQLEYYLQGKLLPEEHLLMEARLLLDVELSDRLTWQQKTYSLLKTYGRKKLRTEIERVNNRMFSEEKFNSFRKKIQTIFKP
jgi:hypothetical protein